MQLKTLDDDNVVILDEAGYTKVCIINNGAANEIEIRTYGKCDYGIAVECHEGTEPLDVSINRDNRIIKVKTLWDWIVFVTEEVKDE